MKHNSTTESDLEQHRTIADVAKRWKVNPKTAKNKLANEPGVLRFESGGRVSLRIPTRVIEDFERRIAVAGSPTNR